MSHYVDGFVVPVPRAKPDAYKQMSERCASVWCSHGSYIAAAVTASASTRR